MAENDDEVVEQHLAGGEETVRRSFAVVEARVRQAFGAMPFGGIAHFDLPQYPKPIALDDVARNLERLVTVLERVAKDGEERDRELDDLRMAIRGFGRLIGGDRRGHSAGAGRLGPSAAGRAALRSPTVPRLEQRGEAPTPPASIESPRRENRTAPLPTGAPLTPSPR